MGSTPAVVDHTIADKARHGDAHGGSGRGPTLMIMDSPRSIGTAFGMDFMWCGCCLTWTPWINS